MKKRIIFAAVCLLLFTTACTDTDKGGESSRFEYSSDDDARVEEMLGRIYFGGEPLPLPFTQSDLPEGFSFGQANIYRMGENEYHYCGVMRGDENIAVVYLDGYEEGMQPSEFTARSIGFSSADKGEFADMLSFDGITAESTLDDVTDTFGAPTSKTYGSGYVTLTYSSPNGSFFTFWGKDHGELTKAIAVA